MATVKEYQNRIAAALGAQKWGAKMAVSWNYDDAAGARLVLKDLRLKQKELRQIKKEINYDTKAIRQSYQEKIAAVGSGAGLSGFLIGKQRAASMKADQKRKLSKQRDQAIAPYNDLKLTIDRALHQMDGAKLEIEQYIAASK